MIPEEEMYVIRLGWAGAEYFELTVHGPSIPRAEDYWDGNWLRCTAEVAAGSFCGSVTDQIRRDDLARFLPMLESLYQRLDGRALLTTLEDWLELQVVGDGRGHIEVRGRLRDCVFAGNQLEFLLTFDQTFLPPLIRQLRAAVEAFPVLGRADG